MADEIQGFGGFDLGKVKDAVGSVVGAGDEVAAAVAFVRDHGDDVIRLLGRLPELLTEAAGALSGASDDVSGAAAFLIGGESSGPGVKSVAGLAASSPLAAVWLRWPNSCATSAVLSIGPATVWPPPPTSSALAAALSAVCRHSGHAASEARRLR